MFNLTKGSDVHMGYWDTGGRKTITVPASGRACNQTIPDEDNGMEIDDPNARFAPLKLTSPSQTRNRIRLRWKRVSGASKYVLYGNRCNTKTRRYKKIKLAEISGLSCLVRQIGGKNKNYRKVLVNKSRVKLKKGKTFKIRARAVGTRVKRHKKIRCESSNPSIATVTKKGRIKALTKGKCTIYVYAQNGKYKAVKVTVR